MTVHSTNYVDTFIAVSPDTATVVASTPPVRATPSVAERMYALISENPYSFTSDDVIFTVWADRAGLPHDDRALAREEFFAVGRACMRSSDLAKRYGWGIHSDSAGRIALVALGSAAYEIFASGSTPDGTPVTVTPAMRSSRA